MQHILITHSYLTRVINSLYNLIEDFFISWSKAIARTRQCEANRKVAPMLKCEYPNMSVNQIEDMLNRQTLGLPSLNELPRGDV